MALPFSPPETASGKVGEGRSEDLLPGDLDNVFLALEPQQGLDLSLARTVYA